MAGKDAVYTRGSIGGTMLKTGVAMLAATLAMSGYNIADTYFVGRLPGAEPLAAMGFTFPVVMLIGCVFRGLAVGVMSTSAQALGASKHTKATRLIASGLLLITLFSIVLGVIGILTGEHVFEAFGAQGETLDLVRGYMNIWYFGCLTSSLSMTGNDLLITCGASKTASAMMMAGLILNVILDPIFIFGWGIIPAMGIRGAALATIISQCVSTVAVLWLLYKRYELLEFKRIPWRAMRGAWRTMIRYAIPATLGMLMMPIGSAVLTRITAEFGDIAVAATAAAGRLEMIAFIFPMALGVSLMPMVSQNYGAKLYQRIRDCHRFSMGFAFCYLMTMAVIYVFFAHYLTPLFSSTPEVQEIMTLCMRIVPWGFAAIEIHRYSGFFYTGCGRPAVAAWLNGLRIIGLMIPFSLVAMWFHSLEGLFFARLAADVLAGAVGYFLSRRLTETLGRNNNQPKGAVC